MCSNVVKTVLKGIHSSEPYIDTVSSRDGCCSQKDSTSVSATLSYSSLAAGSEELDGLWSQPPRHCIDTTVTKNLKRNRKAIMDSINPSKLFGLYEEFGLDETVNDRTLTRKDKAEQLLKEIEARKAVWLFLQYLEKDTEHLGHRYILSLLRGEEFTKEEDREESKLLKEQIKKEANSVVQGLNPAALVPHLAAKSLITNEERFDLTNIHTTTEKKTKKLLSLLNTKGPLAHFLFVHECLAVEDTHPTHKELYEQLTASRGRKKRKLLLDPFDMPPSKAKRRPPPVKVPTPIGLTTATYSDTISTIRRHQHVGGEGWRCAEDVCHRESCSPDNPTEVRVAMVLESASKFSLNKEAKEVTTRVEEAREMIAGNGDHEFNEQLLHARCECVLAKLHLHLGDIATAHKHINKAFNLLEPCEYGEDHIIANFTRGCIVIEDTISPESWPKVKESLESAKCLSGLSEEPPQPDDFGLGMVQYCNIYLALARIGSSVSDPRRALGVVSGNPQRTVTSVNKLGRDAERVSSSHWTTTEKHVKEAQQLLSEVGQELPARIECLRLCAQFDVYMVTMETKLASECIGKASRLVEECSTEYDSQMVRTRQQLLKELQGGTNNETIYQQN